MNPDLRTVTIVRDIAEEEAATAYDALSVEVLELREKVEMLRREMQAIKRAVLEELVRIRNTLA